MYTCFIFLHFHHHFIFQTLEIEVDLLHEDKRKLRSDAIKHQQELDDKKFKVAEQERVCVIYEALIISDLLTIWCQFFVYFVQ